MMQATIFDYAEARRRRDEGIGRLEGEWTDLAFKTTIIGIEKDREPYEFTSDWLRLFLIGIGSPPHPNCYGALMNKLVSNKIIEFTGKVANSGRPASHHRMLKIYRWTS
jgi:hypothetical protein